MSAKLGLKSEVARQTVGEELLSTAEWLRDSDSEEMAQVHAKHAIEMLLVRGAFDFDTGMYLAEQMLNYLHDLRRREFAESQRAANQGGGGR